MTTTNFPNGVTNATESDALGTFIAPDPSKAYQFFDEFNQFQFGTATTTKVPWLDTLTTTTMALDTATEGGVVAFTSTTATTCAGVLQWSGFALSTNAVTLPTILPEAGKKLWYKVRFKHSTATAGALSFGLQPANTSPSAATGGIWLAKATASALLTLQIANASVTTSINVGTLLDATWTEAGFAYDGQSTITAYLNGQAVGAAGITNLPTSALAITFGVENKGQGVASVLSIDAVFAGKQRAAELA